MFPGTAPSSRLSLLRLTRLIPMPPNILGRTFATARPRPPFRNLNPYQREKNLSTVLYASSILVVTVGLTYAAVPLYRLFCQATGFGGTIVRTDQSSNAEKMIPDRSRRRIRVSFNADTSLNMNWEFRPQQTHVYVYPGETALVFYTARNPTNHDIIGISTYNVVPMKTGSYFNKIQCFCFEEQKLKAGEKIDMPVFFFIDPDFLDDPQMQDVKEITLSYTFFQAKRDSIAYGVKAAESIGMAAATVGEIPATATSQ